MQLKSTKVAFALTVLLLPAALTVGSTFRLPGRPSIKGLKVALQLGTQEARLAVELVHDANGASEKLRQLANMRRKVVKIETKTLGFRDVPEVSFEYVSAKAPCDLFAV